MNTLVCPACGEPHALFWLVSTSGKPLLKYRCNRQKSIRHYTWGVETHSTSQAIIIGYKGSPETAPYETDPTIPEVWSKRKIKKAQQHNQPVFPI